VGTQASGLVQLVALMLGSVAILLVEHRLGPAAVAVPEMPRA
jgi:hypothetical protein